MNREDEIKMQRAKAWCFDKGVTAEQMEAAWNNAIVEKNLIVSNLNIHGLKWWWLPPHLLEQLVDRYSVREGL